LQGFEKRLKVLEERQTLRKLTFPTDGKLVIPVYAADPAGAASTNGQIYYNSTTKAFRKYTNSTWKNFETA
jgi:hypothetical protein